MNTATTQSQVKSRVLRWLSRIFLGFTLAFIGLLGLGAVYQYQSSASDLVAHPPMGELIDIGGHRLHLYCIGTASPTVILEAGGTNSALVWALVQGEISQSTRVCSYDRAGFGWSDLEATEPRSSHIAQSLHKLLEAAEIEAPYILVGHSNGGLYVREFAQQYPDEVIGMVLVDSAHENQSLRQPSELASGYEQNLNMARLCQTIAPFGLIRLSDAFSANIVNSPLDENTREAYLSTMYRSSYCSAALNEMLAAQLDTSQAEAPRSLGDLPLIVLTQGEGFADLPAENRPPNITDAQALEFDNLWLDMQSELAALSTNSQHLIVEGAGHAIQLDRPDSVIEAVLELVETLR